LFKHVTLNGINHVSQILAKNLIANKLILAVSFLYYKQIKKSTVLTVAAIKPPNLVK